MDSWVQRSVCDKCFEAHCSCHDRITINVEHRWVVLTPKTIFKAEQGFWEIRRETLSPIQALQAEKCSVRLSLASDILPHTITVF